MRLFIIILFILAFAPVSSFAQTTPFMVVDQGKEGEILSAPICSKLINRSDQTIMGMIATMGQKLQSGDVVKHRSNFRLAAGEEKEICASGPFYEGRRLELVIRTVIPLFSCKTKIDQNIFLDAKDDDTGFRKLSATCR